MSFESITALRFVRPIKGISAFAAASILIVSALNQPSSAIESTQGSSSFKSTPYLSPLSAINTEIGGSATYSFEIKVPEGAGASLQAVRVSQTSGVNIISFENSQSRAYLGNRVAKAQSIPLAQVGGGKEETGVLIPFETPVPPGNTVTITLQVERNPRVQGIYQFGVTAFPVGDSNNGIYLGTERVNYNYSR
jgi:hypothetical protein